MKLFNSKDNVLVKLKAGESKKKECTSIFPCSAFLIVLLVAVFSSGQPAKGANKFLGNITTRGQVRSDFITYWNQITGENECKWGSIEGTRDVMNWSGADRIANYAKQNNIPWKFHTLVWGGQYPNWITSLSQSDQLAEINEWFDAAAARYPDVQMIDVVNEAYIYHAPPPFKNALGGDGATGYDWIVTSFKMARQRWPRAILIYNDYNTLEWGNEITWIKQIIPRLIAAGAPIDAVGFQAHGLKGTSTSTLKSRLDDIYNTIKVPMLISEYDIGETNDQIQLDNYKAHIPVMWNHPGVAGITIWGYIVGATWVNGTGILTETGTERPALTWLKDYIKNNPNPPNNYPNLLNLGGSTCSPTAITPYIQIDGGSWQNTSTATLNESSTIKFGPQPASGGTWSWSGPNGYSASTREITISSIKTSQAGDYTATYTNTSGCRSAMKFTISVKSVCIPTAITPYFQIDNGAWQNTSTATLNEGSTLKFGPQPASGGAWSWSGPNGYSASTREITIFGIKAVQAGIYTATYTNVSGCNSVMRFTVTVNAACTPTAITPYLQVNGGAWQNLSSATVNQGASVKFGPQPVSGGTWSWSGPGGYSSAAREITISGISSTNAGTYTATFTNASGCKSSHTFTITIAGSSGSLTIRARGNCGSEQMQLLVNNSIVKTWDNIGTSLSNFTCTGLSGSANIKVQFSNDGTANNCDKNLFIDYIVINGTTIQAEAQSVNTGVWNGSSCGGAASEWLHCGGYIDFGSRMIGLGKKFYNQSLSADLQEKDFTVSSGSGGLNLNLRGFNNGAEISIYDLNGVAVYRSISSASGILVSGLKKGMYIVNVKQGKVELKKKIVIK